MVRIKDTQANSKTSSTPSFETSKELKVLFNTEFERWRTQNRGSYEELSRRCGLSASYLSQIGRYGRIPSRSALILLALNLDINPPERVFQAARIQEPWPFDNNMALRRRGESETGFLTVKFDSDALLSAVREVVRKEIRPRTVRELTHGRPLRIGLNPLADWTCVDGQPEPAGFFTSICQMIGMSLQCPIVFRTTEYSQYLDLFARDELDAFGPVVAAPNLPGVGLFSFGLYHVGMAALFRKRKTPDLVDLPAPKTIQELATRPYEIALLRNGRSHLIANTRLGRSDERLIICDSHDEALDRVLLKGIKRGAHVFLVNSAIAHELQQKHPKELDLLFAGKNNTIDRAEVSLTIRPDWPELLNTINESISFLGTTGALEECFNSHVPKEFRSYVEPIRPGKLV